MIGRDLEVAEVEALLDGAAGGISGALLVSGEPGIGKTALLGHARKGARGAQLLEMTGVEAESHLAFAGLSDLLGPILGHLDELPGPQAAALRGALALGPPVPGDRFTAYAGAFGLLAAAAERRPVVCIVDDAHWLDAESLEALIFTARRLGAEGIALLLGARDDVSELVETSGLERLRIRGLDPADAARLLVERAGADPDDATAALLVAGAAGNPLALIELAEGLSADQLAGREPLPDPLPVGPHLARGLLRPLEALPERTRRALLIASADDGAGDLLEAALAASDLEAADLAPAEQAGVLQPGAGGRTFRHPLLRGAVYGAAEAPDRRAAHRALAEAAGATEDPDVLDRRAWHLAAAATGPDEVVAAVLERAAAGAGARTAYSVATEALEAAARLSPEPIDRGRRLIAAGQMAVAAGSFDRAAGALDEVIALAADPEQLASALPARGFVEAWGGSSRSSIDMLVAAADRMEGVAPPVAAYLLAQAVLPCHMRGDLPLARKLCDRATALAGGAPPELAVYIDAATIATHVSSGFGGSVSPEDEALLTAGAAAGDPIAHIWAGQMGYVRLHTEDYDGAEHTFAAFIEAGRSRNTPSVLPHPLAEMAEVLYRRGRFTEALSVAAEAAELAWETGQAGTRGFALAVLAQIEAAIGKAPECLAHSTACLEAMGTHEAECLRIYASSAPGLLYLGLGDLDAALRHLVEARRLTVPHAPFNPLLVQWPQDLVETRIRLGDIDGARRDLGELEELARRAPAPSPRASVARCRGLMGTDESFEDHFSDALRLHGESGRPFERARTLLCLGERRRRARRTVDARSSLAEALIAFEGVGAECWASRARDELRAAGGDVTEPRSGLASILTPQELRVAFSAADGATIREIASALLISPKTVESHLGRVYAKLGIHTRAELASRMAAGDRR